MSIASRNGKLHVGGGDDATSWRRREDLLTADVFGAYRYLPVQLGLGRLLAGAVDAGGRTLQDWAAESGVNWPNLRCVRCAFWPTLAGREPDLVIVLGESATEPKLAILVEVKLHADQHVIDGRSQVGHYGATFLEGEFEDERIDVALPSLRPVVFITKSNKPETPALVAARSELSAVDSKHQTDVFWTSWNAAAIFADDARTERAEAGAPAHELALFEDLISDLAERGFRRPRSLTVFPLPALANLGAFPSSARGMRRAARSRLNRSFRDVAGVILPNVDGALRLWRMG